MCNDFLHIIYLTINWYFFTLTSVKKKSESFRTSQKSLENYTFRKITSCHVVQSAPQEEKLKKATVLPQYDHHFSSYDSKMVLGMAGGSTEIHFIWETLNRCLLYHSADTWGPRVPVLPLM